MSDADLERWPDYERQSWQQRFAELDRQYRILQSRVAQRIQELQAIASEREAIGRAAGREEAARYVEGHGGVIPGATVFASLVTGDRMPCMSGDGRDKMMPHKRRYFDDATRDLAAAIRALSVDGGKDGA